MSAAMVTDHDQVAHVHTALTTGHVPPQAVKGSNRSAAVLPAPRLLGALQINPGRHYIFAYSS
jgi:hypothetical protein